MSRLRRGWLWSQGDYYLSPLLLCAAAASWLEIADDYDARASDGQVESVGIPAGMRM
jgi:hypothetical protein